MMAMSDDELEAIREKKRQELAESDGSAGNTESAGAKSAPDQPIHVESVDQFSDVTTQYDVVLVDFYADWCGPCKMLEPIVKSIAAKTDAAVAKVDIDRLQGLAAQYGVRGVPTLIVFSDGQQVEQVVGAKDEAALTELVQRYT